MALLVAKGKVTKRASDAVSGKQQKRVLEILEEREGSWVARATVEWEFARRYRPDVESIDNVGRQIQNMLRKFAERGLVEQKKEFVTEWEEFVQVYPDRARTETLRAARRELLPLLPMPSPQFGTASRENRMSQDVRERWRSDREERDTVYRAWAEVETLVAKETARGADVMVVAGVIARGRKLFGPSTVFHVEELQRWPPKVSCEYSFGGMLARVDQEFAKETVQAARELYDRVFPMEKISRTMLKARLMQWLDLHREGKHETKTEYLDRLYEIPAGRAVLEKLPGFKIVPDPYPNFFSGPTAHREYGDVARSLLDQHALAKYAFVRLKK